MPAIKDFQDAQNAKAMKRLAQKVLVFVSEVRLLPPEDAVGRIRELRREMAVIYKQLNPFNTHMRQGKDIYDSLGVAAGFINDGRPEDAMNRLRGVGGELLRLAALVVERRGQRSAAVIKSALAHGVRRDIK